MFYLISLFDIQFSYIDVLSGRFVQRDARTVLMSWQREIHSANFIQHGHYSTAVPTICKWRNGHLMILLPNKWSQINKLVYTVTNRKYWKVARRPKFWIGLYTWFLANLNAIASITVSKCKLKTRKVLYQKRNRYLDLVFKS